MSDDVEAKLAALEARLAALQDEVTGSSAVRDAGPQPQPAPPPAPEQSPEPPPAEPPPPPGDPLEQFGVELRRLSHELVAAYDRVLAHERRAGGGRRVVLEVQADLASLAALERALTASPGVRAVELQAYAGGHASLVVQLS